MKLHGNNKYVNEVLQEQAITAGHKAIAQFIQSIEPMSMEEIKRVLPALQYRSVKRNEVLIREGEVSRNIYFLTEGFFRMFYIDYTGNEINYRFTGKNNFFADFQSFLLQNPSHFYWQAMQDSELFVLSHGDIHKLYALSPVWNNFGRRMSERVYLQLNERVEMLLFMTPEERYQHLLNTQPFLIEQVSQFHLSSYLGIKPESLSRLRKRLSRK